MTDAADRTPIFILGMLQRTGTNHLWDLFGLHPDVAPLQPVYEDHLIRWTPHLAAFVEDVARGWSPDWNVPASESEALLRELGGGVLRWLASHADQRIVTKMPSVEEALRFFDVFDRAPLVVLVRDGRSVCESGVKTFGWSYERAFRRWAQAADVVLELRERHGHDPRLSIVRYEDVIGDPKATMATLCKATGLDVDRYPMDAIDELPIRGSSTLRSEQGVAMHWLPEQRTADFDPRRRFASWDDATRRRFATVAGRQQRLLGYEVDDAPPASPAGRLVEGRWDELGALALEARSKAARARRALARVHGRI